MQAFDVWRTNAHEARLHRQKLDKAVRRFRRIALAAAWSRWREAALVRRRSVAIVARVHARMASGAVSRAFRTWCDEARASRRSSAMLGKALCKLANRKTAAAFASWKQVALEAAVRRRVLEMSLRRMRSIALASAFGHWAEFTSRRNKQVAQVALLFCRKSKSQVRSLVLGCLCTADCLHRCVLLAHLRFHLRFNNGLHWTLDQPNSQ